MAHTKEQNRQYQKQYYKADKEYRARVNLYNKYNLTRRQWNEMLDWQDRKCLICKTSNPTYRWNVDHDHETDEIRGILCNKCNNLEGFIKKYLANKQEWDSYLAGDNMATEEGRIKTKIKNILYEFGVYYLMPVVYVMGATGVDFHCVIKRKGIPYAFFIEAKRPGGKLTARQKLFISRRRKEQKALTFVIDGPTKINALKIWLEAVKRENEEKDGQYSD